MPYDNAEQTVYLTDLDSLTPIGRTLKRGGADAPHNMQWQTREAAKAKDRWE